MSLHMVSPGAGGATGCATKSASSVGGPNSSAPTSGAMACVGNTS